MTGEEGNRGRKFYCINCIAPIESECICNRIVGYDAETGTPRVDMTKEEWAYLFIAKVTQLLLDGCIALDSKVHKDWFRSVARKFKRCAVVPCTSTVFTRNESTGYYRCRRRARR